MIAKGECAVQRMNNDGERGADPEEGEQRTDLSNFVFMLHMKCNHENVFHSILPTTAYRIHLTIQNQSLTKIHMFIRGVAALLLTILIEASPSMQGAVYTTYDGHVGQHTNSTPTMAGTWNEQAVSDDTEHYCTLTGKQRRVFLQQRGRW